MGILGIQTIAYIQLGYLEPFMGCCAGTYMEVPPMIHSVSILWLLG